MRRMKPETKRLVTGIIAIFLALIMVLGMVLPFVVQGAVQAPPSGAALMPALTVEGGVGFGANGLYKVNVPMPVTMLVANNGAGFDGEVRIRVNLSADADQPVYAEHSYPLSLPQGGSRRLTMNIVVPTIAKGVLAEIADAKGNVLASKLFPLTAVSETSALAGVLSDNPDGLAYLRLITLYNNGSGQQETLGHSLLTLAPEMLPESPDLLNAYNLLVVNDFDSRSFSPAQAENLSAWVQAGGTLLLGTGRAYNKVTEGLAALGLPFGTGSTHTMTSMASADGMIDVLFFNGEAYLAARLPDGGEALAVGDGGQPVIQRYALGAGNIVLCAFDLGLSPLPESAEFTALLQAVLEQAVRRSGVMSDVNMLSGSVYSLDSMPNMSSGMLTVIYIFLAAYILFLGPVLYIVLKKKDKRDAGWLIIPAVAVASTLVVYLFSMSTAYKKPYVNAFGALRLTNGSPVAGASHLFSAYSPAKGNVELSFGEPISLAMPYNQFDYRPIFSGYSGTLGAVDGKTRNVMKLTHGDTPSITYYNGMAWKQNTVTAERTVTLAGGLDVSLSVVSENGGLGLAGSIVNNTGLTLEDLTVFLPMVGYYSLGTLTPGATVSVASGDMINATRYGGINNLSNLAYELFEPYYYYRYTDTDLSNEELRVMSLKRGLLEAMGSSRYDTSMPYASTMPMTVTGGTGMTVVYNVNGQMVYSGNQVKRNASTRNTGMDITVFAFTRDAVYDGEIRVNKQAARRFDMNLLVMDVDSLFVSGTEVTLPYGFVNLTEVSASGYAEVYETEVYLPEGGDVEFAFRMPEALAVTYIRLDCTDVLRTAARVLIWNASAGDWELLDPDDIYGAADFVDGDGCVRVRAEQLGNYYSVLPTISVTGIVR